MAGKSKILAIDDSKNVLDVIAAILTQHGFEVVTCQLIDQAIESVNKEMPDLLILDVMMPSKQGIDGFSICKRIKEEPKTSHIPVIFLTGIAADSGQSEDDLKNKAGAEDFIHKPFNPDDLVQRVKKHIHQKG